VTMLSELNHSQRHKKRKNNNTHSLPLPQSLVNVLETTDDGQRALSVVERLLTANTQLAQLLEVKRRKLGLFEAEKCVNGSARVCANMGAKSVKVSNMDANSMNVSNMGTKMAKVTNMGAKATGSVADSKELVRKSFDEGARGSVVQRRLAYRVYKTNREFSLEEKTLIECLSRSSVSDYSVESYSETESETESVCERENRSETESVCERENRSETESVSERESECESVSERERVCERESERVTESGSVADECVSSCIETECDPKETPETYTATENHTVAAVPAVSVIAAEAVCVEQKVNVKQKKVKREKVARRRMNVNVKKKKSSAHSLAPSDTHSLIHSDTHSLIHSDTHSLIHSDTHSLIHSDTQSLIHSDTNSLIHSNILSGNHSPIHSAAHSIRQSLTPSDIHTYCRLLSQSHADTQRQSLTHSDTHSLSHSPTKSDTHSTTHIHSNSQTDSHTHSHINTHTQTDERLMEEYLRELAAEMLTSDEGATLSRQLSVLQRQKAGHVSGKSNENSYDDCEEEIERVEACRKARAAAAAARRWRAFGLALRIAASTLQHSRQNGASLFSAAAVTGTDASGNVCSNPNVRASAWLLRLVRDLYRERHQMEQMLRRSGNHYLNSTGNVNNNNVSGSIGALAPFAQEYLMTRYGAAALVRDNFERLRMSVCKHRVSSLHVEAFARFMDGVWTPHCLQAFLRLSSGMCGGGFGLPVISGREHREQSVSVSQVGSALESLFRLNVSTSVNAIASKSSVSESVSSPKDLLLSRIVSRVTKRDMSCTCDVQNPLRTTRSQQISHSHSVSHSHSQTTTCELHGSAADSFRLRMGDFALAFCTEFQRMEDTATSNLIRSFLRIPDTVSGKHNRNMVQNDSEYPEYGRNSCKVNFVGNHTNENNSNMVQNTSILPERVSNSRKFDVAGDSTNENSRKMDQNPPKLPKSALNSHKTSGMDERTFIRWALPLLRDSSEAAKELWRLAIYRQRSQPVPSGTSGGEDGTITPKVFLSLIDQPQIFAALCTQSTKLNQNNTITHQSHHESHSSSSELASPRESLASHRVTGVPVFTSGAVESRKYSSSSQEKSSERPPQLRQELLESFVRKNRIDLMNVLSQG